MLATLKCDPKLSAKDLSDRDFLLTKLPLDTLKASAPSRVVCVSSVAHAGMRKWTATIDLDDDAPNHSGAYCSQNSLLYANKQDRTGGWPMRSPNTLTYDDALAERLHQASLEMVGLKSGQTTA